MLKEAQRKQQERQQDRPTSLLTKEDEYKMLSGIRMFNTWQDLEVTTLLHDKVVRYV